MGLPRRLHTTDCIATDNSILLDIYIMFIPERLLRLVASLAATSLTMKSRTEGLEGLLTTLAPGTVVLMPRSVRTVTHLQN